MKKTLIISFFLMCGTAFAYPGISPITGLTANSTPNLSNATGTLAVANGGTGTTTTFTQNSVVFAGAAGIYSQDNANFNWNDSTNILTATAYGQNSSTIFPTTSNIVTINNLLANSTPITGTPAGTAVVNFEADQKLTGAGTTAGHGVAIKGSCINDMTGGSASACLGVEGVVDFSIQGGGILTTGEAVHAIIAYDAGNASATVTNLNGMLVNNDNAWAGTATTTYGFHMASLVTTGGGTFGTKYSFASDDVSAESYNLGSLAIGTTTQAINNASGWTTLQVSSSTAYSPTAPQSNGFLTILNTDTGSTDATGIYLRNNTTSTSGSCVIAMLPSGTTGNGSLRFNCRNAGTFADDMTITPTGTVGIGTTAPRNSSTLDVNGTINVNSVGSASATPACYSTASGGILSLCTGTPFTTAGTGLSNSGATINSNAVYQVSFQPGLVAAVTNTKSVYAKVSKASTVDNIEGSASAFSCASNPTVTFYECGTSATCASSPTTIGTVTITASGQVFDGTVNSAAITAGDYIAWAITAGTCTSLDISANAQVHSN